MKICILAGSPRKNGNTEALLTCFMEEVCAAGADARIFRLYDLNIQPCLACRSCQKDWTVFGCARKDDVQSIFDCILESNLILLATPIYSWYCTPPMKALLDRLVYGMNKYYGGERGPSLWKGKRLALLETCGYRPEKGADLFEEGMRRYFRHSGLEFAGCHAERHLNYDTEFMDGEKAARTRAFARRLLGTEPDMGGDK